MSTGAGFLPPTVCWICFITRFFFYSTEFVHLFLVLSSYFFQAGVATARNLTYGAPEHSDLGVVKGVLKMLDMKNILAHLQRLG